MAKRKRSTKGGGTLGGAREGAGRKTRFPGKLNERPISVTLTETGVEILDGLRETNDASVSDVVEHLLREKGVVSLKDLPPLQQHVDKRRRSSRAA